MIPLREQWLRNVCAMIRHPDLGVTFLRTGDPSSRIVGISLILRLISLRRNLNFRKISIPLQLFRSRFAEQFSSRRYCLSGITQSCRGYAIFTEYWILSVCDLFELYAPLSITKWYPSVSDFEVFLHDKKQERDEVGIFGKISARIYNFLSSFHIVERNRKSVKLRLLDVNAMKT